MKYDNIFIGSRLMETITSGLYDGNLNCIREYIQNSIDSKANNIEIFFENGISDLVIKDDGTGMNKTELEKSLGIGTSNKSGEDIGWRGIGIWSGVPVCKRIVIISKEMNNKKYRIEINNDTIRELHLSNKSILDILSMATSEIEELPLGREESFKESHFTMIRLESILPTQRYVFSDKEISNYLSMEVPVPLDRNFTFAGEIDNWLNEKGVFFPNATIMFNRKKLYRPPFRSDIYLNKIIKKEFYIKDKLIAVGWFLTGIANEKLRMPNVGIYFKKKGFTIGDANLVLRQFSGTYHPWQYGEIHIISNDLRENAARNNFEYNSGNVGLFLKDIGDFVRYLEQLNRYKSQRTSPKDFEKIKEKLRKESHISIDNDLLSLKKRFDQPASFPQEPSLQVMKSVIDSEFERYRVELTQIKNQTHEIKQTNSENTGEVNINNLESESPESIVPNSSIISNISGASLQENVYSSKGAIYDNEQNKKNSTNEIEENLKLSMKFILNIVSPIMKSSLTRITKKGLDFPAMGITDPMRDLLKDKTGLTDNEIFRLSKAAYGWENIIPGKNPPMLLIDSMEDNNRDTKHFNRNLRFGVMIYAIHDLFVNLSKHELGKDSLQWFEDTTREERDILNAEMIFVVDFICRLIEKSKNQKSK